VSSAQLGWLTSGISEFVQVRPGYRMFTCMFLEAVDSATAPCSYPDVLISADPDVIRMLTDPLRARIIDLLADGQACVSPGRRHRR
jgi:hypothetical protein